MIASGAEVGPLDTDGFRRRYAQLRQAAFSHVNRFATPPGWSARSRRSRGWIRRPNCADQPAAREFQPFAATFDIANRYAASVRCLLLVFTGDRVSTLAAESVAIAEIQPQCTVIPQNPFHVTEHGDKLIYKFLRGFLKTDLAVNVVISKTEVWRRRDTTVDALIIERLQEKSAIAIENLYTQSFLPVMIEYGTKP